MSRSQLSVSAIANRYAQAVFELAEQEHSEKNVVAEFLTLAENLQKNPDILRLLESPQLAASVKARALAAGLSGAQPLTQRAVTVIAEQGRSAQLCEIAAAMAALLRSKNGLVSAHVTFATAPDASQQQAIGNIIAKFTGKTPEITTSVNPELIGGFTVEVDSTLMDASVRARMESIRLELTRAA